MPSTVLPPSSWSQTPLRRAFTVDPKSVDAEKRTVAVAFSSETPVLRWGDNEVLSHAPGACDLSRLNSGGIVLFNHDRNDYVGVVQDGTATIGTDLRGRAILRFAEGERADKILRDIAAGVLRQISVGYTVLEWQLTHAEDGQSPDTYTAIRWQPYEISIVTIAADPSVGIGRSRPEPTSPSDPQPTQNRTMPAPAAPAPAAPADTTNPPPAESNTRAAAPTANERTSVTDLLDLAAAYSRSIPNARDLADEAIRKGHTAEQFQRTLLEAITADRVRGMEERGKVGMSEKDAKSFRFTRLFNSLFDPKDLRARDAAGFEFECVEAARAKGLGKRGIPIPAEILTTPLFTRGSDIISVKTAAGYTGTGGALVNDTVMFGSMIELLQNKAVMLQLCSKLTDLVGNIAIPKVDGGPSAGWVGEDGTVPTTDADFSQLTSTPKTLAALTQLTRTMLIQPSISMEAWVRSHITLKMGLALDLASIAGTGADGQPTGILNTVGVPVTDFAAALPTFTELVAMETAVANANADVGQMRYIATPGFRGHAKTTPKFANVAGTIWEPGNQVNGYGCEITNQVPAGNVIFGNFADLLVNLWVGMEILTDRDVTTGGLKVSIFQDADIKVLRTASFNRGYQATP